MSKFSDTHLQKSQNNVWKSQLDFWLSNGTTHSEWGELTRIEEPTDFWIHKQSSFGPLSYPYNRKKRMFLESEEGRGAPIGDFNEFIYEPCNYASNIAFYRSVIRVCDYGESWSINEQ